jgi:hypothetical protein
MDRGSLFLLWYTVFGALYFLVFAAGLFLVHLLSGKWERRKRAIER